MATLVSKTGIPLLTDPHVASIRHLLELAVEHDVDLFGIDLQGVDLREARLRGGRFREAIFNDALLEGADFTDADVRGATFFQAKIDDRTRFKDLLYFGNEFEGSFVERKPRGDRNDQAKTGEEDLTEVGI